jgi:hypothetical protein
VTNTDVTAGWPRTFGVRGGVPRGNGMRHSSRVGAVTALAAREGNVFHYGDAPDYGDIRALGTHDVIALAATAPPLPPELLGASAASKASVSRA